MAFSQFRNAPRNEPLPSLVVARHRRTIRHYNDGTAHALTFSCYRHAPLLECDERRRLLSSCIDRAVHRHGYGLVAFVYMPDHVHLLVFPGDEAARVQKLLYAIKRPFSARLRTLLEQRNDPLLNRLMVRERPGKSTFRFWQKGPGYDRNLDDLDAVWETAEYFHQNPVVAGFCKRADQWKWSSCRHDAWQEAPRDPDLPLIHGYPDW